VNTNAASNTVAFFYQDGGDEFSAVTQAPTRVDDGVERAWRAVHQSHKLDPAAVSALVVEWKPTAREQEFIARTFPNCREVQFYFNRPDHPREWEAAMAAAGQSIAQAMHDQGMAPPAPGADTPRPDDAGPAGAGSPSPDRAEEIRRMVREAMGGRRAAKGKPGGVSGDDLAGQLRQLEREKAADWQLLPVLVGPSSGRGQALMGFPNLLIRQPLVPEKVHVALAFGGTTPHGTIGLDWYGRGYHEQLGEPPFAELLKFAADNLRKGIRATGRGSGRLEVIEIAGLMAGSAVVLPDLVAQMAKDLGTHRLIAGVPCPDHLVVTRAESSYADDVRRLTLETGYDDGYLGPTVLLLDDSGITVLADRQI
jgi:hypothetical protein